MHPTADCRSECGRRSTPLRTTNTSLHCAQLVWGLSPQRVGASGCDHGVLRQQSGTFAFIQGKPALDYFKPNFRAPFALWLHMPRRRSILGACASDVSRETSDQAAPGYVGSPTPWASVVLLALCPCYFPTVPVSRSLRTSAVNTVDNCLSSENLRRQSSNLQGLGKSRVHVPRETWPVRVLISTVALSRSWRCSLFHVKRGSPLPCGFVNERGRHTPDKKVATTRRR